MNDLSPMLGGHAFAPIPADAMLCYVCPRDGHAYFTTQSLADQWGDDWDDAPYEHNAEPPYEPAYFNYTSGPVKHPRDWNEDGTPKWAVFEIAWSGDWSTPATIAGINSRYSVRDINARHVPWLTPGCGWGTTPEGAEPIFAGTTVADFVRLIQQGGGTVYWPLAGKGA